MEENLESWVIKLSPQSRTALPIPAFINDYSSAVAGPLLEFFLGRLNSCPLLSRVELPWPGCVYGLPLEPEALTNRKLKARSSGNVLYLGCVEKI